MANQVLDTAPEIFDERICQLGESPLWHPVRQELFWVDLPKNKLLSRGAETVNSWEFGEMVSALGWVDEHRLVLASETGLSLLNLDDGTHTAVCAIEDDRQDTRSNDSRADSWGGFWVGTMSKEAEAARGAIYRWYCGELRQIVQGLTIPNGICFDRARHLAYYADSARHLVFSQALDPEDGWPVGAPEIFLELSKEEGEPDGAVVDMEGCMWLAHWGASRVVRYGPEGKVISVIETDTPQPTCPAFGGAGFGSLYITTASLGLEGVGNRGSYHGTTLVCSGIVKGIPEPRVRIAD